MTITLDAVFHILALIGSIFAAGLWVERRITKIETLLMNHLAHHEAFEVLLTKILEGRHGLS